MDEILALKLDADWVVLSACNTDSGTGAAAEAASFVAKDEEDVPPVRGLVGAKRRDIVSALVHWVGYNNHVGCCQRCSSQKTLDQWPQRRADRQPLRA
jgi:hypothetical protein